VTIDGFHVPAWVLLAVGAFLYCVVAGLCSGFVLLLISKGSIGIGDGVKIFWAGVAWPLFAAAFLVWCVPCLVIFVCDFVFECFCRVFGWPRK
jgi:hypothetical protein